MAIGRKQWRVLGFAAAVGAGSLAVGCSAGHGEYTGEFKKQAEARMAGVKAGTNWDMAQQQYRSGDLKKALENVEQSIALNGEVPKSHMLHGKVLLEMGRLETALDAFARVLELEPESAEASYYRGIIFERFNRPQEAFEAYSVAQNADPANPQYALACAECLIAMGEMDHAQYLLSNSASEFEHNAGIKQTLGHIAKMRGATTEAVQLFNDAYLLDPEDEGLLEDLARAQIEDGQYGAAERSLDRLLAMASMDGRRDLERLRVKCLTALNKPVEARTILRRHLKEDGGTGEVHTWIELGNIALLLGDQHELRHAAGRVIAMAPERHEGFLLMGAWQRREGLLEKAALSLERSALLTDSDPSPAILLHLVRAELGQMDRARGALQHARALAPDDPRVNQLMGSFEQVIAGVPTD